MSSLFGGTDTRTLTSTQTTKLPDWVVREGENIFQEGKDLAGRDFPIFDTEQRVSEFSPETLASFDQIRNLLGYSQVPAGTEGALGGATTSGIPSYTDLQSGDYFNQLLGQSDAGDFLGQFGLTPTTSQQVMQEGRQSLLDRDDFETGTDDEGGGQYSPYPAKFKADVESGAAQIIDMGINQAEDGTISRRYRVGDILYEEDLTTGQLWQIGDVPVTEGTDPSFQLADIQRLANTNPEFRQALAERFNIPIEDLQGVTGVGDQIAQTGMPIWMQPFLEGISGIQSGMQPTTAADIEGLMNPFQQSVIDELNRQEDRSRIARNASMSSRGSYLNEGRREAIDALGRQNTNTAIGQVMASNYFNALAGTQADKARAITGGTASIAGGGEALRQGFQGAAGLEAVGMTKEQRDQQLKDLAYGEFINSFTYPQEQVNYLMALLTGTPVDKKTIKEEETPFNAPNKFGQIASVIGMVAAAASHPSFKENPRPVEHILPRIDALTIEAWDYKPGIEDGATHIGPYAHEWKSLIGTGDGVSIPYIDLSGVALLGVQELNRKLNWHLETAHA